MTLHIKKSGTFEEIDEVHIKVSGTWEKMDEGHVKKAGTWEQFFKAITASVAPSSITETTGSTGIYITTATAVITVDPVGTYTYQWSRTAGDTDILALDPTLASTKFTANMGALDHFNTTFQCVVKEAGITVDTLTGFVVDIEQV